VTAALGLGAVIGLLLGLLGGGGSILAVPALVYGAGQPLTAAVPTSLVVVGISSAVALLPRLRARQIRWRIAALVGGAGAAAAFAGAAVNRLLDPRVVLIGFAALMVAVALGMLRGDGETGGDCALPGGGVDWRGCLPKSVGTGLAVGFLTGLFGVGGGFLLVPALVLLLGLPMASAVGTSLVVPCRRQSRPSRGLLAFPRARVDIAPVAVAGLAVRPTPGLRRRPSPTPGHACSRRDRAGRVPARLAVVPFFLAGDHRTVAL
jgi:uncharacterized membrane protein YfcA